MSKVQILIVDDHQMFRTGIKTLLSRKDNFEIVGETNNGSCALSLVQQLNPDVVVLDIHIPKINGIDACQKIVQQYPKTKVLALSAERNETTVVKMVRAGALAYILKDASINELVSALNALSKGNSYFSKEISAILFTKLGSTQSKKTRNATKLKPILTERENEVLKYISNELTNKEIATQLFISPRTVETHRRNLIQKLKVKNTVGLVKHYLGNVKSKEERLV